MADAQNPSDTNTQETPVQHPQESLGVENSTRGSGADNTGNPEEPTTAWETAGNVTTESDTPSQSGIIVNNTLRYEPEQAYPAPKRKVKEIDSSQLVKNDPLPNYPRKILHVESDTWVNPESILYVDSAPKGGSIVTLKDGRYFHLAITPSQVASKIGNMIQIAPISTHVTVNDTSPYEVETGESKKSSGSGGE